MDASNLSKIKQEVWPETPCSNCLETYCCRNMPLAPLTLDNLSDFINLIQTSCYNGILPALRKTGEWTFYLKRDCRFLDKEEGKCTIYAAPDQSLICKSYNAHSCWYREAFGSEKFSTLIPFNTEMILWYEKRYKLIEKHFDVEIEWEEVCKAAHQYKQKTLRIEPTKTEPFQPWTTNKLSFKNSKSNHFLFFPPYKRPEKKTHFELLSFRLGFPGIYLAITNSCWAFIVETDLDQSHLNLIRKEYYPTIGHKNGAYSFDQVKEQYKPYSKAGDQWIILQRSDLEILKNLTTFDDKGRVIKIPESSEILIALNSNNHSKKS